MNNNFNHHLNIKLIKRCPICQTEYNQSMVQVINESEFGVLTYATCNSCGASLLTKFASMPQGVVGNAILTDLKAAEVMEFAEQLDLQADDVLAVQEFISNKNIINEFKKTI